MPVWVDLSEHEVSLNVYNSPNGKRLILRPLAPQSQIPPDITELGFEQRGGAYERRDLQFSLPQLRKYFPKAISREFAMSEIFFRQEEPSASDLIERYQWQRNRAGDQAFGNRQEVRTLTEAIFNEHVKPGLRSEYAETLLAYRAKQPSVTHCSLVQVAGTGEWRLDRIGPLEECRPSPENPAWVKKIDDFFSQEATDFGGIADDDARPRYQDGRTIPAEDNEVTDVRGGFGGSPVYLYGKVVSRRGSLRVQITGTLGLFNESASASTEPLSNGWTLKGEKHPYERQLRQAGERDKQWKKEHADQEADLRARADLSKAEGYPHLDMIDPPVGARIENIEDGRIGTIIEYFELGDVLEPTVLFDDEPAGSGGVTIGGKQHRYRYRVIAAAPIDIVEEVAAIPESPPVDPVSIARTPWHVTRSTFIEESSFLPDGNGHGHVIFDNIQYHTEEKSAKKAKDEVHARLVKDALYGKNADPFQPSLPTFEVMLDYPNMVYQLNQRAEKNISRLLAQLGVAAKLLVGDNSYLKVENSPYMDLVIERLPDPGGDRLYLTHYFRSNGDSVMDAEMVFCIRKNGTLRLVETATQNPFSGGELRGRDVSFANMFSKNLLDQGFGVGKALWPREEEQRVDAEPTETSTADIGPIFEVGSVKFEAVKTFDPRRADQFFWRAKVVETDAFIPTAADSVPKLQTKLEDDLKFGLKGDIARWRMGFDLASVAVVESPPLIRLDVEVAKTAVEDAAALRPAGYDMAKIGRQLASYGWTESTMGGGLFPYRKTVNGVTYEITIGWKDGVTKENRAWLTKLNVGPARLTEELGSVELDDAEWAELRIANKLTTLLQFDGIDPTTPEGYAKVLADEALQLKFQDILDAFFSGRIVAVRNALSDLGWEDSDKIRILKKNVEGIDASVTFDTKNVGSGRNVVQHFIIMSGPRPGQTERFSDDLTKTPSELAAQLDGAAFDLDLESVHASSPLDLYAAELSEYWESQGKEAPLDLAQQRAKEFFEAIATRDSEMLISRLAPSQSPISRRWFEKVTGISLGRTSKETKATVIAWAGTLPPTDWLDSNAAINALGIAVITDVGEENIYVRKDNKRYFFKPGNTNIFQVGNYDFSGITVFDEIPSPLSQAHYEEGDRVRFTPNQVNDFAPIHEGLLVAKESTSSGNWRLTIRKDEDAPQGGGKITARVYSQDGAVEVITPMLRATIGGLPDFVRSIEGRRAKEAWEQSCLEHEDFTKRTLNGFWQMARALSQSPAGESSFPDSVKTAISTICDTLRFGHPSDWNFDGALAHLAKVGDKLAQELQDANIANDAKLRDVRQGSSASYRGDIAKLELLREKTVNGTCGGLISFADSIFMNIDASPITRFTKAYSEYLDRIGNEITRLDALATEKETKDAAQAESIEQAKFSPFDPSTVRMPTAIQLGLDNKFQSYQDEAKLRLIPGGWSNGHILDIANRPKVVLDAISKYFGDETSVSIQQVKQKDIDRILDNARAAAIVMVTPIAGFDDEFIDTGAIKGSGLNIKRGKDKKVPINAVVLANQEAEVAVQLDRRYFGYFTSAYKGCEFLASTDGAGAMLVKHNDRIVGIAMPIRNGDMQSMLKHALAVQSEPAKTEASALSPYEYGKRAFARGINAPALDSEFMKTLTPNGNLGRLKEWTRGWTETHVAATPSARGITEAPDGDDDAAANTTQIAELSREDEVRRNILDDKQEKAVTVLEAANIFEESISIEDQERSVRLYEQAKDMLNKARISNVARELIRDLPIIAQLNESKARVESILTRYSAKKTEISRMRQSGKKDVAYEQAQAEFDADIAGVDAALAQAGSKYKAERLPNLAVESAIEYDFIGAADDGGKLREAYDKANNSERKAWDHILALRAAEAQKKAMEIALRITADNLEQYLTAADDSPQVDFLRLSDVDPAAITLESIRGYGQVGTVEVNDGFGRTAGKRFGTLTISRPIEDAAGVVRDDLTVKISSDGKREAKYGLVNAAWRARNDTALLSAATRDEREFLADVNRAHFRHRQRGLARSSVASILNLLHGVEDVRGAANYGFALAEVAGGNLKGDYADQVKAAFTAHEAKKSVLPAAASAATMAEDVGSAQDTVVTGIAKVNVYGESDEIAVARNEVIAIALREHFTEKGAREYADEASRGNLSASQRELGTSELVAAADRLYRACQANASLAKDFAETLNAELAAEEHQAATDFAFRVRGFSDGLVLVAHNQNLEVRCPDRNGGAGHVVTVSRLEAGQYKAHHGSAESRPATLLAAVRWASNLLDELLAADLKVQEGLRREIKVYVDGFRQFLPAGQPLDREALMESIQLFSSDDAKTPMVHMPKFLGSGTIRRFSLPDDAILEFAGEDALRISAAGYTCEIQATEPAPEFDEDRPWIRRDYERNAPISFVGALASASAWLKENQAWESKKASYPDEGRQVEALAHQYAASLHESMPTHHDGGVREMHRSFAVAIMDKHVDYLMGWIARGRGQNDLSKKFFAKATGCKLPSTIRDITGTLYAWAGFTPEQAATREAEKEAALEARLQARRIDNDIEWCGNTLGNSRVNHEGEIKTTKQFIDEILDKGYTHIGKHQSGAAVRYTLENPEIKRSYNIKGKMVDYAKAVLAKREQEKQEKAEHVVQDVREEEPQSVLRP